MQFTVERMVNVLVALSKAFTVSPLLFPRPQEEEEEEEEEGGQGEEDIEESKEQEDEEAS